MIALSDHESPKAPVDVDGCTEPIPTIKASSLPAKGIAGVLSGASCLDSAEQPQAWSRVDLSSALSLLYCAFVHPDVAGAFDACLGCCSYSFLLTALCSDSSESCLRIRLVLAALTKPFFSDSGRSWLVQRAWLAIRL